MGLFLYIIGQSNGILWWVKIQAVLLSFSQTLAAVSFSHNWTKNLKLSYVLPLKLILENNTAMSIPYSYEGFFLGIFQDLITKVLSEKSYELKLEFQ